MLACLKHDLGAFKIPDFLKSYLRNYSEPIYENWTRCSMTFPLIIVQISTSETSQKKS